MNTFIVFFLLSSIVIALFYNPKNTENFATKFNGNVHIRGEAKILTDSNKKIKCDKLCIKDSITGKTSCIEPDKLFYLTNNKDHRLKMICLGNTCINQNHIDILKGRQTFKLANYKNRRCLGNNGTKYPIKWLHDDNDDCKHFTVKNVIAYTSCNDGRSINFHLEPGAGIPGADSGGNTSGGRRRPSYVPPPPALPNKILRPNTGSSRGSSSGVSL